MTENEIDKYTETKFVFWAVMPRLTHQMNTS